MARSNPENRIAELEQALAELAYAVWPNPNGCVNWDLSDIEPHFREPMRKAQRALNPD